MKTFLTLSLAGMLLTGAMIGTLVDGTDEPIRQWVLLSLGARTTTVAFVFFRAEK